MTTIDTIMHKNAMKPEKHGLGEFSGAKGTEINCEGRLQV